MNRRIHIALSTHDVSASVADYSVRLGQEPDIVVENEYALWKTPTVNFSLRCDVTASAGTLRHLGWEDSRAIGFSADTDVNGILWERFSEAEQLNEIKAIWPDAG